MIKALDISKTFCTAGHSVQVLSGITFSLETGKTLTISGKSGSGKTTLLNCLGGIEKPDKGSVLCMDTDITALSRKKRSAFQRTHLGFVFQGANLLSHLTVRENIAFPLVLNKMGKAQRQKRVDALLDQTGLSHVHNARPATLSGGQAQRAAFARAIAHTPMLLLADEPTASLDTETGLSLIALMTRLAREQQCTIIIATHDPDIIRLADHTLQLKDGKIP